MVHAPPAPKERLPLAEQREPTATITVPAKNPQVKLPTLDPECYVILGRIGDLINIFPVFREKAKETGRPVSLVAGREFWSLFNGVTYIQPDLVPFLSGELGRARQYAYSRYRVVRSVQVWGDDQRQSSLTRHYNMEAWQLAGALDRFKDKRLFPVFDARNMAEEDRLIDRFVSGSKPVMVISVEGGYSSPFVHSEKVKQPILRELSSEYDIVDLSRLMARSFQDILGIMEMASVMVLADSSPLHLAAATTTPVVALLSDKGNWNRSEPRCRTIWSGDYDTAITDVRKILQAIRRTQARQPVRSDAKIVHAVEQHREGDEEGARNCMARRSWFEWYGSGRVVAAHLREPYARDGRSIGDRRRTPFLKEVLNKALDASRPCDAVVWTNADTIVRPDVTGLIWRALAVSPITTQRRVDFETRKPYWGRDLFAFRASWLKEHWNEIPDFLLGAPEFDNWMALFARRVNGIDSTAKEIMQDVYPADIPAGALLHIAHDPVWDQTGRRYTAPENLYNLKLLRDWCRVHQPRVQFDPSGHVNWKV